MKLEYYWAHHYKWHAMGIYFWHLLVRLKGDPS